MANSTAREFLYIVQESALGTPVTSPTIGTNSIFIRLPDSNAFSMVAEPVQQEIMYGGGLAKTAEIVSDHYQLQGTLKTNLYAAQAQFLLNWSAQEINSGGTSPWTTSELPSDLASCSIYHAIRMNDGSYLRKVYSGAKVSSWQIEVSRQSTYATSVLGITACTQTGYGTLTGDPTTTPFPDPDRVEHGGGTGPVHLRDDGRQPVRRRLDPHAVQRPDDRGAERARRPVVRERGAVDPELSRPQVQAQRGPLPQGDSGRSHGLRGGHGAGMQCRFSRTA